MARRTVFCFAIADLLVAILLLAAELGLLFVIVLCLDEIWNGALGLNRKFGRVRPRCPQRDATVLASLWPLLPSAFPFGASDPVGSAHASRTAWTCIDPVRGQLCVALTGIPWLVAFRASEALREHGTS